MLVYLCNLTASAFNDLISRFSDRLRINRLNNIKYGLRLLRRGLFPALCGLEHSYLPQLQTVEQFPKRIEPF